MRKTIAISPADYQSVLVAVLHYRQKLSQKKIVKRLKLSPMQVSRNLAYANARGYITSPTLNIPEETELPAQLISKLEGLRDVRIVYTNPNMGEAARIELVATAAADFWENFKPRSKSRRIKVGLSGGRAIATLVDLVQLPPEYSYDCCALANIPSGDWGVAADTNLAILKRRFPDIPESNVHRVVIRPLGTLQLSPELSDEEIAAARRQILGLQRVQEIMKKFAQSDLVFTGVGSIKDKSLLKIIRSLRVNGPFPTITGDIAYNFVHHKAKVFSERDTLGSRLTSVSMKDLKAIAERSDTRVVAVAWGAIKAKPLLDAYRGGVINTFIIDSELALEALKLIDNDYLKI
jgi:DNA-binding transcriptional regulator LsrR (DeoR family)